MKKDLLIAGVGGQGTIFASRVIYSFAISKGFYVLGTETIGAAQRGGSVVSHIRMADNNIYSPLVPRGQADILLGFEPLEMLRNIERLNPNGIYLLNMDKIPTVMCNMGIDRYPNDDEIASVLKSVGTDGFVIHATTRAYEISDALLMNIIMLGALSASDSFFEYHEFWQAVIKSVNNDNLSLNQEAFKEGYSIVRNRILKEGDNI